ncbi:MAG: ATP-binding cassette domain-containing protein [Actinobacteria bacterium]|jgi:ABC-type branched-subunit amino acid transport system ATPase component|uniref:Unannotated protein n=1 Tax=freshwater metagenome TaxID=449393 RepID=A0A6J7GK76_9ZZZZ|nr:ATP-binding cassette domain-containing protein [Actinomycetota bacterium]MSV94272.1 ATP-binding cassette domain-containing protein [Actinomycetota bacterium]MSW61158.1 ATP-binding cassette domain-containing protein [Actinomycetota bacterium]
MTERGGWVLLEVSDLTVNFGGLRALDDVSLSVSPGRLVGLIGPNGAGKTTAIDALTGFVSAQGSIQFAGERIDHLPAHERARKGLVRTFQSLELFEDLDVRQNLVVGLRGRGIVKSLIDAVTPQRTVSAPIIDEVLVNLGIEDLAERLPKDLSQGQRKLVAVARALVAQPKLVLLDEPAAGLDSSESIEFGKSLRHLVDDGLTVLLVDHDMSLVLEVCDDLYVLEFGRIIASGPPNQVRSDPQVIAAYLGHSGANPKREA